MPIPLCELALVILLVPAAIGMEITCLRADRQWDPAHVGRKRNLRHLELCGNLAKRSSCNEESMLAGWDVQLRMQAERRESEAVPQAAKVTYENASL